MGDPAGRWHPAHGGTGTGTGDSGGGVGAGGPKVGDTTPGGTVVAAKATLTQAGTVTTAHGTQYPASTTALTTGAVKNLIVDDFQQFTFDDPATGQTLNYNLFVPKDYNPRKRYPLVLFMYDASVVNVATEGPLVQGLGAVCWASPEDQARHEAFVLAPEYGSDVRSMKAQRTPVNFAAFEAGTVVPTGSTTSAHMATWQVAYTIPGIRDWIMRQSM
ncbi:hypothetical protein [Streptomyces hokutonensis]|uniref:hypothetical protein n=1 Tax=Streptomyces hokutonensis TaxID=1306990 RepID=UPI0036C69C9E